MMYRNRSLRRLWRVMVFHPAKGKSITDRTPRRAETLVAWNAVDAIRQAPGQLAREPEPVCWVTWDDPPRRIENTQDGPLEVVEPSIALRETW